MKLGQQSGFNLFELPSNPLLVFFGQHSLIIRERLQIASTEWQRASVSSVPRFLSTTYPHPIPHIPAKPRFSPVRWDKDAQLLPLQ